MWWQNNIIHLNNNPMLKTKKVILWACEHEQVSMSKKWYSKIYFPCVIKIFLDRSIHYGRIFFDKNTHGKIFFNTILHGEIFFNKKEYYEAYSSNNEIIRHVDTRQQFEYKILQKFVPHMLKHIKVFWRNV
jgi:hypothetical protein